MSEKDIQTSTRNQLLRSICLSILVAFVILITVILPAEYNVDPTGMGEALGIKGFSAAESTASSEQSSNTSLVPSHEPQTNKLHDSIDPSLKFYQTDLILEPYGQVEFKLKMKEGARVSYTWFSGNDEIYADLHGHTIVEEGIEGKEEEIVVRYHETQQGSEGSGSFETPFTGDHGWYFLSLETHPITIRVNISGSFNSHELTDLGPQG